MKIHLGSVGIGAGITIVIIAVLFFGFERFSLPHGIEDGDLVQGQNSGEVYLIENGVKRHIVKTSTFDELGFTVDMIKFVSAETIDKIPKGEPIITISDID